MSQLAFVIAYQLYITGLHLKSKQSETKKIQKETQIFFENQQKKKFLFRLHYKILF